MNEYINLKIKEKLTGFLKFNYVNSHLSAVIESNSVELNVTRPCEEQTITRLFNFPKEKGFYGTIVFEFCSGVIIGYAYSKKIHYERGFERADM